MAVLTDWPDTIAPAEHPDACERGAGAESGSGYVPRDSACALPSSESIGSSYLRFSNAARASFRDLPGTDLSSRAMTLF